MYLPLLPRWVSTFADEAFWEGRNKEGKPC